MKPIEEMDTDELRAAVATEIMGWKRLPADPNEEWVVRHEDWWSSPLSVGKPPRTLFKQLPDYPRDIAAAWQVVEQMRSLGWYVAVQILKHEVISLVFNGARLYQRQANAPAEAIVRAALLAVRAGKAGAK